MCGGYKKGENPSALGKNKIQWITDLPAGLRGRVHFGKGNRMNDLISREAVLALPIYNEKNLYGNIIREYVDIEDVKQLPPANCSEFPNNSDTISRQDMVSRRRLLSDLKELITAWEKYPVMAEQIKGVEVAIGYVELIPSAQPELRRGEES